jgi:hypothetical protein
MRYAEVVKNIDPNILLDTENRQFTKSQSKVENSFKLSNILTSRKTERSETIDTGNIFSFNKAKNVGSNLLNPTASDNQSRVPSNISKENKANKNCILDTEKSDQTLDLSVNTKKQNNGVVPTKTNTFLNIEKSKGNLKFRDYIKQ